MENFPRIAQTLRDTAVDLRNAKQKIEHLEKLLQEACKKLEQRPVQTLRSPPPLADCSPELRDWWGAKRKTKQPINKL